MSQSGLLLTESAGFSEPEAACVPTKQTWVICPNGKIWDKQIPADFRFEEVRMPARRKATRNAWSSCSVPVVEFLCDCDGIASPPPPPPPLAPAFLLSLAGDAGLLFSSFGNGRPAYGVAERFGIPIVNIIGDYVHGTCVGDRMRFLRLTPRRRRLGARDHGPACALTALQRRPTIPGPG